MRTLKRLLLGLGLLVVLVAAVAGLLVWRQLPRDRTPAIAGLRTTVSVDLDDRALPTIHAQSLEDASRIQGYLVARERLFQMELMRRTADGRLAEAFGPAALPLDRLHRTYGFRQVAEQALAFCPASARRSLEAYAVGVNAFIEQNPGRWGLEFQVLGLRPEPWRPEDGLKVLLLMHEDLSTSWKSELQVEALAGLPAPLQRFLQPAVEADDRPLVPDDRPLPPDTAAFLRGSPAPGQVACDPRLPAWLAAAGALPAGDPEARLASNNWVLAGSRTRTGKPLLANDPHLGLNCPGIWFPLRLLWPGHAAQGVALPGLPSLVIGHNERIAWGFTNLGTDLQDLYREPALEQRQEWIPVKGRQPVALVVATGKHGPQVLPGLSLHWPALDPRRLALPEAQLEEARDWATFNAAIDGHPGPPQNMLYADVDGHIGWRASGLVPVRRPGDDGSRIHDGTDPAEDWRGFVPPQAMPRLLDPPAGFLATANNRTIGTSFPQPVATGWASMSRAGRILERLEQAGPWDAAAVEALQRDPVSRFHLAFIQGFGLLEALPGFAGAADPDTPLFTRAELLRRTIRRKLLEHLLKGSPLAPKDYRHAGEDLWLLAAAQASPAQWQAAGLGDKAAFLRASLAEARQRPEWNRPWGEVNELKIRHPFGLSGGLAGWLFNPAPMRLPGSARSIRVMTGTHGQSLRLVVDLADLDATRLVIPLGLSGHLGSSHREDQAQAWRQGDPTGERTQLHQPPQRKLTFLPK
ncbi:MAG: penicillin acylase family protein [Holophagaceae bacterium]|uniref:Penicillin acylase family protein n=1 Tax=Candidatus Geothrix skivensis TaxID=2954439 RepID=A0A9D7XI64_9BACT|nr:penicillin acylase family protein [Candidatus Geothrix skivensis]